MRPTLLNFRSPNERTPEYYDVIATYQGDKLHFRSNSMNKKMSNLPQCERFPQYNFYQNNSGVSCFIGPGTYNDHEDFLKLTAAPTSIKMVSSFPDLSLQKKVTALPEQESGKPCYIMIGNNLKFEPSFLSTRDQKRDLSSVNAETCPVHVKSILKKRSISQIKQRMTFTLKNNGTESSEKLSFSLPSSIKKQYKSGHEQPQQDNQRVENFYDKSIQRPQTCIDCQQKITHHQRYNMSASTKASMSAGKYVNEFGNTIGSSNLDKSTTIDPTSSLNLKRIQEEEKSQPNLVLDDNGHQMMSDENQIRIKSMLPKTANNFHKMKKGLYLNPIRGFPYNHKEEALARSLNILQAYGEIIPTLSTQLRKKKSRGGSHKKQKNYKTSLNDSLQLTPDQGYMNIIRDTPVIVDQREKLERQKREILNMQFDNSWKKKEDNKQMNKFLSERYTHDSREEETNPMKQSKTSEQQNI